MLFKRYHIIMILEGKKTATRRVWKSNHANKGSILKVKKDYSSKWYCTIEVTRRDRQKLRDMTEEDAYKEGRYSLQELS